MLSPTALMNTKCAQLVTPLTYNKNNLKIPSRKLWSQENVRQDYNDNSWFKYRNANKNGKWDVIESPQFVDFSNVPDVGDSFFNKVTVIVSTPKPNYENEKLPSRINADDTLVAALDNFCLSGIRYDDADITVINKEEIKDEQEKYVVHDSSVKLSNEVKPDKYDKIKKPLNTAAKPFTFDLREKYKQEHKQQRIDKILEDERKMRVFRANPLPKFIKTRSTAAHKPNNNQNSNNNNNHADDGKMSDNANKKVQDTNPSNRRIKNRAELWKKPPFIPSLPKKNVRPKTPPLYSLARAQERRRFNEAIREKEREKERLRQMEIAAKKKQEEDEIAELRKQTIHKAQPIRKYKYGLPQIQKRPLTDPVSPISLKRRRRV